MIHFEYANKAVELNFKKDSVIVKVENKMPVELPKNASIVFLEFTLNNIIKGK